jgi:hypothetical protein
MQQFFNDYYNLTNHLMSPCFWVENKTSTICFDIKEHLSQLISQFEHCSMWSSDHHKHFYKHMKIINCHLMSPLNKDETGHGSCSHSHPPTLSNDRSYAKLQIKLSVRLRFLLWNFILAIQSATNSTDTWWWRADSFKIATHWQIITICRKISWSLL